MLIYTFERFLDYCKYILNDYLKMPDRKKIVGICKNYNFITLLLNILTLGCRSKFQVLKLVQPSTASIVSLFVFVTQLI